MAVLASAGRFPAGAARGASSSTLGGRHVQQLTDLPYRVFAPGIGQDGFSPAVRLSQTLPFQGGAILVTVTNAASGTARVFGREYLLAAGTEGLAGIVGFGTEDPPGAANLMVHVVDRLGQPLDYVFAITVRRTEWTFDDIYLPPPPPPDPNAPPPPPPPPSDQPFLDAAYQQVSPRLWQGNWQIPLELGGDIWVSGYFGEERSFNGGPRGGHHGGTDIAAPATTPVRATNRGVVALSMLGSIRGNVVAVDHGTGIVSSYGHMSAANVSAGQTVERGDILGFVGSTGLSTGPHLHWEMSVAGVLVDGLRWLDGTQGF